MARRPGVALSWSEVGDETPAGPVPTWWIFAFLCAVVLLLAWYSREHVFTRAVQRRLMATTLDEGGFDSYWERYQRAETWSYLLVPLMLWGKVAFVALSLQLILVLCDVRVGFLRLFRAVLLAEVVPILGSLVKLAHRSGLDLETVTAQAFYRPVGNLAFAIPESWHLPHAIVEAAGLISGFEIAWFLAMFLAVTRIGRVEGRRAAVALGAVFLVFNFFQWGLRSYLTRVGL